MHIESGIEAVDVVKQTQAKLVEKFFFFFLPSLFFLVTDPLPCLIYFSEDSWLQ